MKYDIREAIRNLKDTKASSADVDEAIGDIDLSTKQDTLVSGTNIKTVNNNSLLGSGNISVGAGSFEGTMDDIDDGVTYVKTENNYTDTEKTKLAGIEAGATKYPDTGEEVFTTAEKSKLSGIATGAEVNVNADWNSGSGDSQILNKPTIISLLDVYPVGAIYISVVSTSPATLFGGTWSAFGAGRVLVGIDGTNEAFDTVEETGGAETHTLTEAEIPSHTHTQNSHTHAWNNFFRSSTSGSQTGFVAYSQDTSSTLTNATVPAATAVNQNTGGGGAHNNLQPYITVYMWKRTA